MVSACDPLEAVRTSNQTKRRLVAINSLILDSSSTTRIRWVFTESVAIAVGLSLSVFIGRRILLLTGSFLRIGLSCPRNLSPAFIHDVENYTGVI